jgi:hypothetical protein
MNHRDTETRRRQKQSAREQADKESAFCSVFSHSLFSVFLFSVSVSLWFILFGDSKE